MRRLNDTGKKAAEWLDKIPKERWTQSYDEGRRYGQMTTNLAECVNSVLKGARHLPITGLVQETYYRLAKLFPRRGRAAIAMRNRGQKFGEKLTEALNENRRKSCSMFVHILSREHNIFKVDELSRPEEGIPALSYRVNLRQRLCDCGKFQALKYPCSHACAAAAHVNVNPDIYIDDVYTLDQIFNVYRLQFPGIPHNLFWEVNPEEPELIPDPNLRRDPKGRPKSSRIRNGMDLREKGNEKCCALCRAPGHNQRNCPNRPPQ